MTKKNKAPRRRSKVSASGAPKSRLSLRGCSAREIARETYLALAEEADHQARKVLDSTVMPARAELPDEIRLAKTILQDAERMRGLAAEIEESESECLHDYGVRENLEALRGLQRDKLVKRGEKQLADSRRGADVTHGGFADLKREAREMYEQRLPAWSGTLGQIDEEVGAACGRDPRWAREIRLEMGKGKYSRPTKKKQ
jgi:hypothetical protein